MIPKIGIDEKHLKKSIDLLSIVLADEMTLYIKTQKFHWNVAGESFMELHKLFEGQYNEIELIADELAERIGKLGGKAIGTMKEFASLSRIIENPDKYPNKQNMLLELFNDNELMVIEIRKTIDLCAKENHDAGSADLLTKILQQHETNAWILRKYLS